MSALKTLADKDCEPAKKGTPPLKGADLRALEAQLGHGWVVDGQRLKKEFAFKDFKQALEFTNQVGAIAEAQDHHPDIFLSYGKVGVALWTHTVDGLSESDFVLAAKTESLPRPG